MGIEAARISFAESLLSLVTSSERAASIAGDLAEEATRRRNGVFWVDLACVSLALLVQGFERAPWRASWTFICGFAAWAVLYSLMRVAGSAAGLQPLAMADLACGTLPPLLYLYLALTLVLSNFLAGVLIGRRSRTGELNACIPLAVFWFAWAVAAPVIHWMQPAGAAGVPGAGTAAIWFCTVVYLIGLPLLYIAPLLYGGALASRMARV